MSDDRHAIPRVPPAGRALANAAVWLPGCVEVTGAVLLLAPAFARAAALVLATVLVGAVFTHLAIIGGSPAPALTLLVMLVTIAAARRR